MTARLARTSSTRPTQRAAWLLAGLLSLGLAAPAAAEVHLGARAWGGNFNGSGNYDQPYEASFLDLQTHSATVSGVGREGDGAGSACSVGAAYGKFTPATASATYWGTMSGSTNCQVQAWFRDSVLVTVPGVKAGKPVRYTAKLKVDGVLDSQASHGMCLMLGGTAVCSADLGIHQGTLKVTVDTVVGATLELYAGLDMQVRADLDHNVSSADSPRTLRMVLSASRDGANTVGASGHDYR